MKPELINLLNGNISIQTGIPTIEGVPQQKEAILVFESEIGAEMVMLASKEQTRQLIHELNQVLSLL